MTLASGHSPGPRWTAPAADRTARKRSHAPPVRNHTGDRRTEPRPGCPGPGAD